MARMNKTQLVTEIMKRVNSHTEDELRDMTNANLTAMLKDLEDEPEGGDPGNSGGDPPPPLDPNPTGKAKFRVVSGSITLDDNIRCEPGDVFELGSPEELPVGFADLVERV